MAYYTIVRAKLIYYAKLIHRAGAIEECVVWSVPKSNSYPDGVRYRLAFIPYAGQKPVILYDNHHPKGHHKHLHGAEMPYIYLSVGKLLEDFDLDTEGLKK